MFYRISDLYELGYVWLSKRYRWLAVLHTKADISAALCYSYMTSGVDLCTPYTENLSCFRILFAYGFGLLSSREINKYYLKAKLANTNFGIYVPYYIKHLPTLVILMIWTSIRTFIRECNDFQKWPRSIRNVTNVYITRSRRVTGCRWG